MSAGEESKVLNALKLYREKHHTSSSFACVCVCILEHLTNDK